jgi:hypothetical protein
VTVNGQQVTVLVQWDDSRGAGVLRGSAADDEARASLRTTQFRISALLAN